MSFPHGTPALPAGAAGLGAAPAGPRSLDRSLALLGLGLVVLVPDCGAGGS